MRKAILAALGLAVAATAPTTMTAQSNKAATYITKEEVDIVSKQPGTDRTIRVVDIGPEHFSVGTIHRGKSPAAPAAGAPPNGARAAGAGTGAGAGAGAGRGAAAAAEPCGERGNPGPAGTPSGLYHEHQTEGYLITSGEGEVITGGHILNGRKSGPNDEVTTTLNGPSCSGQIVGADVVRKQVKVGDIIIIPAGVPHGWGTIPDHVDYLSFRPSEQILTVGYEHPSIKK